MKDILVLLDNGGGDAARVDLAARLAAQRDGHLTGLYVSAPLNIPAYIQAELPAEALARRREAEAAQADQAAALFADAAQRHDLTARSEWRQAHGDPTEIAAIHGRYADLLVVGQPDPARDDDAPAPRPETLLFQCGRPLLLVPCVGHFDSIGERVAVAWNASREAARAVGDAMPLLAAAKRVTVLAINPQLHGPGGLGDAPGADIARHLSRHGCRVAATQITTDEVEPGPLLLNAIADDAADLLVMGAYGRSRWQEWILGGMTRFMLRSATLPVLLSH